MRISSTVHQASLPGPPAARDKTKVLPRQVLAALEPFDNAAGFLRELARWVGCRVR